MPQDVLDKVRKLLALARSPNVHEAAAAAGRAQALIHQHRLASLLAAEAEAEPVEEEEVERARRLRRWKTVLASGLAEANGCLAFVREHGAEQAIVLAGRASDRAAFGALWPWLVRELEWLSATHGGRQDKRWHDDFRVGASTTIVQRLRSVEQEAVAEAGALVQVEPALAAARAAVERYATEKLGLTQGRGVRVDPVAYRAGRLAGEAVALPVERRSG